MMAEVVLLHHALGLTDGVEAFAQNLRGAGHTVHTPDLFEGRTFTAIDDGMSYAQEIGFPHEVLARAERAVSGLPDALVYAGFSLGVLLAQTRPGALGAVLMYSCVPLGYFGDVWPSGVPVQIHGMDADPMFVDEGDLEAAQALVAGTSDARLFLYPGDQHYFAEPGLPSYRPDAAALLTSRVLDFLRGI
jgi:dienelactone hydrolase